MKMPITQPSLKVLVATTNRMRKKRVQQVSCPSLASPLSPLSQAWSKCHRGCSQDLVRSTTKKETAIASQTHPYLHTEKTHAQTSFIRLIPVRTSFIRLIRVETHQGVYPRHRLSAIHCLLEGANLQTGWAWSLAGLTQSQVDFDQSCIWILIKVRMQDFLYILLSSFINIKSMDILVEEIFFLLEPVSKPVLLLYLLKPQIILT